MNSQKRTCGPGLPQRLTCYHAFVIEATPGGRINRMRRTRL
jgi:hypothetical protein